MHEDLMSGVARQAAILQSVTEELDVAAAERLGINHTDLRCISVLYFGGPASAKDLARATRLTPGAFTTVLDRLERAGYTSRVPDPADLRRVRVELTDKALAGIKEIWGPLEAEGMQALGAYSGEELGVILDFLQRSTDLQVRHTVRVRAATTVLQLAFPHPPGRSEE
jgi:DNA-binding MarR family transcriptional regulator